MFLSHWVRDSVNAEGSVFYVFLCRRHFVLLSYAVWLFHSRIVIFISGPLLVFVAAFTSARRPTVVQKSSKTVWGYPSSARHRRHTCTRVVGRLLVSGRVNANGQGGATCPRDGSHRGVRQGGFTWGAPQGVMKFNFVVFIDSVGSRRYMPLHLIRSSQFSAQVLHTLYVFRLGSLT